MLFALPWHAKLLTYYFDDHDSTEPTGARLNSIKVDTRWRSGEPLSIREAFNPPDGYIGEARPKTLLSEGVDAPDHKEPKVATGRLRANPLSTAFDKSSHFCFRANAEPQILQFLGAYAMGPKLGDGLWRRHWWA
jgi:hypothetical protein